LENAQVIFRRSSACGCETIEAKIIDANSMLLQNLKTGAYFYADKQSIEYTQTRPDNGGKILNLEFGSQSKEFSGKLSYLIKGISWKPDYDLRFTSNNESIIRSYANIKNDQEREYKVENTLLLGGDIHLANNNRAPPQRFEMSKGASLMETIQATGEQYGLYSYTLKDTYTLRPSSSIRLPFIDFNVKSRFYYKASINIDTAGYQGTFSKTYDLTPDQFMPAGILTIYDNELLVGQANLPDVPKNFTQTVTVGEDTDIRYVVYGNLTQQSDEKAPIQTQTYQIDLHIINLKNKKVNAHIALSGGIQLTLHNTTCNGAKSNGNQLILSTELQQGENRPCKFNLTTRLN